jgi:hypothetical protein
VAHDHTPTTGNPNDDNPFGPVIHTYTRAQAIADGVLADVTDTAREAGFRWPVALTAAVWDYCVAWPDDTGLQDETGRLWDVLYMAHIAIRSIATGTTPPNRLPYELHVVPRGSTTGQALSQTLHLHAGPGDDGEPVVTIMLPNED